MSMSFAYSMVQLADNLMMMYCTEAVGGLVKKRIIRIIVIAVALVIMFAWLPVSVAVYPRSNDLASTT